MHLERTRGEFDYYTCDVKLEDKEFRYHFEIVGDYGLYYYDRVGLWRDHREHYEFSIMPGFFHTFLVERCGYVPNPCGQIL